MDALAGTTARLQFFARRTVVWRAAPIRSRGIMSSSRHDSWCVDVVVGQSAWRLSRRFYHAGNLLAQRGDPDMACPGRSGSLDRRTTEVQYIDLRACGLRGGLAPQSQRLQASRP